MYIVAQVRDEAHGPLVFKSVPFMDAKVDVSRRCPLFCIELCSVRRKKSRIKAI